MESKLEFPQSAILTPYNYFEWKPKIQLHLRSRGLFRITMETEVEPTSAVEKSRYFNRMDEAFGILCFSISPELLFYVESCSTPNEENIEAAQRDERIRFKIEEWMENPNLTSVQGFDNHIVIGSSPRFPVYESDFGFGPPMCVRSGGGNKYDGKVTLFPGREGGGSVDMEICLWSSALQMLNSDAQFLLQDLNC